MGNYFLHLHDVKKQEESLKLSYKYFHPVLSEHIRNAPAANGLGIVCARRGSFISAIQIFSKVLHVSRIILRSFIEFIYN